MRLPAAAVCTAAALLLGAAGAAARSDTCPHADRTLHVNHVTRVYERDGTTYACWRPTGRVTSMFLADDIYESGTIDYISQRYVAFDVATIPACKADCPPGVTVTYSADVLDVRTGRQRTMSTDPVSVFVVTTTGGAAWLVDQAGTPTLLTRGRRGTRALDAGDITAGSVKLHGHRLRWIAGGVRRSAKLA